MGNFYLAILLKGKGEPKFSTCLPAIFFSEQSAFPFCISMISSIFDEKSLRMDLKALDNAIQTIIKKREELDKIDYSNPKYDELEDQVHDLEDAFQEAYGEYIDGALQDVHDELCPDTDVLMPIAYLKGVYVEADKYPNKDTKLFLLPTPTRLVLNIGKDKQEVVWSAK